MIELPDFSEAFDFENAFFLSCQPNRLSKTVAHLDLYRQVLNLPGHIVECGVFKGASLSRFAMFRALFEAQHSRKIIGFDIFGAFPETQHKGDQALRQRFVENAGDQSISMDQLNAVLDHKGINKNIELVGGDICETVPEYVKAHPELKISLLNLDTDIYEPAVTILEHLYPRLVPGGILIIDDYGTFPGETDAIDEYFKGQDIRIQKFPYAMTPTFLVKSA
ncbi:MAG: TylF/MycF/NovP-related O-methyltransferase [Rhodospirillaceae bacterium]